MPQNEENPCQPGAGDMIQRGRYIEVSSWHSPNFDFFGADDAPTAKPSK
jgi:hypothetical protein